MSVNQLQDDGAVIGYRPTLQYKKESNGNSTETTSSSTSDVYTKIKYSNTVKSLMSGLPSISLNNIDFVVKNMKLLIDKLASSFQNGNWNQYGEISSLLSAIESNNEEYINKFIAYHQNNITGSLAPELIGLIYDSEHRLEVLSALIKELYYGNSSITTEEAKEIDSAYLKKIQTLETEGKIAQINYLAISNDALLNRSVNMYAFSVNQQAIEIADVITKSDNSSADVSKASYLQKLFDETIEEIKYRKDTYNTQQSIEIMQKTLYNYYNERQEILDLYDLFDTNSESVFLGNKIQIHKNRLDDAIINVNRTFVGHQYFLSEMAKLESEKHFLKNLYASFNYNSGN